jgi:thymidylate kinase
MSKIYFITGISGSGKTTVGRKLIELGEVALDSKIQKGLFHFVDKNGNVPETQFPKNAEWRALHKWVLNKKLFDQLIAEHSKAKRIYLCGGADDIEQYWHLGAKVFLLKIDHKTLIKRLNSPDRDNEFGKDEQTQMALYDRLDKLQSRREGLGAIPIDATKSINEVAQQIRELSA